MAFIGNVLVDGADGADGATDGLTAAANLGMVEVVVVSASLSGLAGTRRGV